MTMRTMGLWVAGETMGLWVAGETMGLWVAGETMGLGLHLMVRSENKTLREEKREENKERDGRSLYILWAKIQTGSVFWPQPDKLWSGPRVLGQPWSGPRSVSWS